MFTLFLILLLLKLFGWVDIDWFWVFAPFWMPLVMFLFCWVFCLVCMLFLTIITI